MKLIEPLRKFLLEGAALDCEEVDQNLFGGFCSCGGTLRQRFWIRRDNLEIMISECERCWSYEMAVFENKKFVERKKVEVIKKKEVRDLLKDLLSPAEFEALIGKVEGRNYNPSLFSRAKKRLSDLNLDISKIIEILR
ncbi:MAG: hypothetical protein QFX40_00960 [Archaeoglobales archaeon]|nr:hypothetical protein [Archaeoglobales archaeon]